MARAWVGLTMVACVPCMAMLRSGETRNSYGNCQKTEKCYEYAVMSRKNLCQTSLPPALRHKVYFPYESPCTSRHGRGAGRTGVPGRCSPAEAHGDHGEALVPCTIGVPTWGMDAGTTRGRSLRRAWYTVAWPQGRAASAHSDSSVTPSDRSPHGCSLRVWLWALSVCGFAAVASPAGALEAHAFFYRSLGCRDTASEA